MRNIEMIITTEKYERSGNIMQCSPIPLSSIREGEGKQGVGYIELEGEVDPKKPDFLAGKKVVGDLENGMETWTWNLHFVNPKPKKQEAGEMTKQYLYKSLKRLMRFGVLILLLAGFSGAQVLRDTSFSQIIETDLDLDGIKESIELNSGREKTLQIRRGETLLWQGVPARWQPWKLRIADVDGDGKLEIAVGVFKSTKFFPKPHNCLFIYGFDKNRAFPKWLGSALSRPFTDFMFADLDGKSGADELIATETTLEGKRSLAVYDWDSFGFTKKWQRGDWNSIEIINAADGKIIVEADGKRIVLTESKARNE